MQSDTLIPLAQFIEWLGLDGWAVAGIDKSKPSSSTIVSKKSDDCKCYFKNPWDSDSHWSRDELINALRIAEDFFISETKSYPAPYYICKEKHSYGKNGLLTKNFYNGNNENYKLIRPFLPCGDLIFGKALLEEGVLNVELEKTDEISGDILDVFVLTFQVPEYITESQIRLYFLETDIQGFQERPPEYNDHSWEIRPFKSIKIEDLDLDDDLVDVTIELYSYLLVKPVLQDASECLVNEEETYVNNLDVFFEIINVCESGNFICSSNNCGNKPCSKTGYPLCLEEVLVYKEEWIMAKPYNCEFVDGVPSVNQYYCLPCIPKELEINYITGYANNCLTKNIDKNLFLIIAKLALVFADCVKSPCTCDVCFNKKLIYYRQIPHAKEREGDELGDYGDYYKILVDKIGLDLVDGYTPTRGMIEAMREIARKYKCKIVEGAYI